MATTKAEQAWAEARAFLDSFMDAVDAGAADSNLDAALASLSPEAQMMAYERIIDAAPSSTLSASAKTLQMVGHLMRGGQGTLNDLREDLASMSPEGRAHALEMLTSHPEYRVRGLRWRPNSRRPGTSLLDDLAGQATPGSLLEALSAVSSSSPAEPGVAEPREYTGYQVLVDSVFALVDSRREDAVSQIYESMSLAGAENWTGAAHAIRSAINTLNDLAASVSPLYKRDLAVAHYHLEAYLGQSGDNRGAEQAIRRSLELFNDCEKALPGGFTADVALASMSLAICLASEGNLAGAVSVASDATETLAGLASSDFRAFGPALAEHLSNLANFNLHSGDVRDAALAIDRAVATYEELIASNVPAAPQFVDLARNLQTAIRAAGGTELDQSAGSREDHFVTLREESDGGLVIAPRDQNPFTPDGKADELESLLARFFADFNPPNATLGKSSDPYPDAWDSEIMRAVQLKRQGKFYESAKVYVDLSRRSGVVYGGLLASLYKTVASAGLLRRGMLVLMNVQGMDVRDHVIRLTSASRTRPELESYLRDISGNATYRLPRDYTTMVEELNEYLNGVAQAAANLQKLEKKANGGCYIATAVYGSYDAPQVMTLRHFRDETLAKSIAGRTLIKVYYAASPPLARRLERASFVNRCTKRNLDFIVGKLDGRG